MVETDTRPGVLIVEDLGLVPYEAALAIQRDRVARRLEGSIPDTLIFLEHPPVFTLGRDGHGENLLVALSTLPELGIAFCETDRGGDITYHGPGQIVGYPIVDLRGHRQDLRWYVTALEQCLIEALACFGIRGERSEGERGAWIGGRKIAAVGIHVSRWITSHGFALNVSNDLDPFRYIVPCGLEGKGVTSMTEILGNVDGAEVKRAIIESFARTFASCAERKG